MEQKFATATDSVKKFWNNHKGKIAVAGVATSALLVLIMKGQGRTFNGFLDEKGLQKEFFDYLVADED